MRALQTQANPPVRYRYPLLLSPHLSAGPHSGLKLSRLVAGLFPRHHYQGLNYSAAISCAMHLIQQSEVSAG
jgi:hypothetical protein